VDNHVFPLARRIAVVVGVGDNLGREHRVADNMNAVIPPRQVLLELRRAMFGAFYCPATKSIRCDAKKQRPKFRNLRASRESKNRPLSSPLSSCMGS
jgi:hypothetical protein